MQPLQPDLRKKRPQDAVAYSAPMAKQPIVKLPGEQIRKLAPNSTNPIPSHQPPAQQPEKKSNVAQRSSITCLLQLSSVMGVFHPIT